MTTGTSTAGAVSDSGSLPWTNSIFEQPWWLDAVAPGRWSEARVVGPSGEVVARLPYAVRTKYGVKAITQPPLTQTLGPWIAPVSGKYAHRLDVEKKRLNELVAQLPAVALMEQDLSPALSNWLPLYWRGFSITPRVTYRIDDLSDLDAVWNDFDNDIRTSIRSASKRLEVRSDLDLARFIDAYAPALHRKAVEPVSRRLIERVDEACRARAAGTPFFAVDGSGAVAAVAYVVWDQSSAYYLMGARELEAPRGALNLLVWEAMQFAAGVTTSFDLEGSMIESVERSFRHFGAKQLQYVRAKRVGLLGAPIAAARALSHGAASVNRRLRSR